MQHGTQRWLRPVACVCVYVSLLDGYFDAMLANLHHSDVARGETGAECSSVVRSGGRVTSVLQDDKVIHSSPFDVKG